MGCSGGGPCGGGPFGKRRADVAAAFLEEWLIMLQSGWCRLRWGVRVYGRGVERFVNAEGCFRGSVKTRGGILRRAMHLLPVAVQRGNAEMHRRSGLVDFRE